MKTFNKSGKTIEFYKKEDNLNFSFKIRNDEILTQKLLAICKRKTVKEKDFKYAVPALFEKIKQAEKNDYYEIWLHDGIPYAEPEEIVYSIEKLKKIHVNYLDYDHVILINGDWKNKLNINNLN